ncbi:MAG: class I SAM-dependent methyltransferase [Thermodesulfobacteriota bacterium]|nr:class I SAM-dependent methyltransferase [Thermodesulfobacteriota bacterium]
MSTSVQVAIAPATRAQSIETERLARCLDLPLLEPVENGRVYENKKYLLVLTPERLELRRTGPDAPGGPVYVDFTGGPVRYRREHGGGRRQPLARAVGLKHALTPNVLDATAGLGKDAFVLACLGCRVQLIERSSVLAALLEDGLNRAAIDPDTKSIIRDRMTLVRDDSIKFIKRIKPEKRPDVIYLDPMYPARTKSALVKKEMRILRAVVGENRDAPLLLETAIKKALKRVVVKRPSRAPAISGPFPSLEIKGKKSRFDVYLR